MKDTKWEQLSSIYPHIHPFRDARGISLRGAQEGFRSVAGALLSDDP